MPALIKKHGRVGVVEYERAARRCDLELVTGGEMGVEIAAGRAVRFALHGDAVIAAVGWSGEGVVSKHRLLGVRGRYSEREVLAGTRRWQPLTAGILQANGDHGVALPLHFGDRQRPKACPGGRWAGRGESSVAATRLSLEHGPKRALPAGAERGDAKRSHELLSRVPREIEERVGLLGDRHLFWA